MYRFFRDRFFNSKIGEMITVIGIIFVTASCQAQETTSFASEESFFEPDDMRELHAFVEGHRISSGGHTTLTFRYSDSAHNGELLSFLEEARIDLCLVQRDVVVEIGLSDYDTNPTDTTHENFFLELPFTGNGVPCSPQALADSALEDNPRPFGPFVQGTIPPGLFSFGGDGDRAARVYAFFASGLDGGLSGVAVFRAIGPAKSTGRDDFLLSELSDVEPVGIFNFVLGIGYIFDG